MLRGWKMPHSRGLESNKEAARCRGENRRWRMRGKAAREEGLLWLRSSMGLSEARANKRGRLTRKGSIHFLIQFCQPVVYFIKLRRICPSLIAYILSCGTIFYSYYSRVS